ncbi:MULTISPECIES: ThiF family adenylyltransferase [unclassified Afipia]|uniref:ThiF family adenylyltransferase n=1 Tax=unclassified Afipia TaxID=2642050 RepID=UPI00040F57DD|nr:MULTISPECIES: ThiF family adenylyltransferase [unclassified Afipia]
MSNMTELEAMSEGLNRLVKIALDTGEASTIEEAQRIFAGYRMQIAVGGDVADSAVLQAILLTAANCGARAFLGGVSVVGACGELAVSIPGFSRIEDAVTALGAQIDDRIRPDLPTLVIGDVGGADVEPLALRATFADWCGGVIPAASGVRLAETGSFTPAGVLAGAIGVAEIFQRVRGGMPMACRRVIGLDLWDLHRDWLRGGSAPLLEHLPSEIWIVGMGNLGQAYLWTLGLLPYGRNAARLVLQDTDVVAISNLSTSMLTTRTMVGRKKTRAMAEWAEARGFETSIVERDFTPNFTIARREPSVALIGVDNALARQAVEDVGFGRVIEAGLGRGPQDFLGIDLHTFPASRPAREVWPQTGASDADITLPAYRAMLERSGDRCGTVRLAGRSIGAPFVGSAAAALAVSELVRLCTGGKSYELVSCHLRDLQDITAVVGPALPAFNPGSVAAAA